MVIYTPRDLFGRIDLMAVHSWSLVSTAVLSIAMACCEAANALHGGGENVRLIDWEDWSIDAATDDLAYMMAMLWYPDRRRRMERPLLDRYHAELLNRGVSGYDRRALDDDYRLSALWLITRPVL